MKYNAQEFRRYADMLAPRASPSILADMLRCAVDEAERLREPAKPEPEWFGEMVCGTCSPGFHKTAPHLP